MLDPTKLFPEGYHPGRPNRTPDLLKTVKPLRRSDTKEPVRYYFIDFGISSWFRDERSDDMVETKTDSQPRTSFQRLVTGRACQDGTVPELQKPEPYDPFPVDIYLLGRVIRNELVNVSPSSTAPVFHSEPLPEILEPPIPCHTCKQDGSSEA